MSLRVNGERPERNIEEPVPPNRVLGAHRQHRRPSSEPRLPSRGAIVESLAAYDVNPNPENPGELTTAISLDDATASIELALSVREFFRLSSNALLVCGRNRICNGWMERSRLALRDRET